MYHTFFKCRKLELQIITAFFFVSIQSHCYNVSMVPTLRIKLCCMYADDDPLFMSYSCSICLLLWFLSPIAAHRIFVLLSVCICLSRPSMWALSFRFFFLCVCCVYHVLRCASSTHCGGRCTHMLACNCLCVCMCVYVRERRGFGWITWLCATP